jgi:hypothetical protein
MRRTEFKAVCPFCNTHLLTVEQGLAFPTFGQAVARIKAHWTYSCGSVPHMKRHEREVIAENNVQPMETP